MYILGLNYNNKDAAACLLKDGKLIAAAEEERFLGIKHTDIYPKNAINFCLNKEGITIDDIDYIAKPDVSAKKVNGKIILDIEKKNNEYKIPHHLCHAASAFRLSDFKKSNILTSDGRGEIESAAFFIGDDNKITRQWSIPFDKCSIGGKYKYVTMALNFGYFGEGKTMGLAPYGRPQPYSKDILYIKKHNDYLQNNKGFNLPFEPRKDEPLLQHHKDLAASVQHALEISLLNLMDEIYDTNPNNNICLAGGVFFNCKLNGLILKRDYIKNIFIHPNAGDGGCAIGAALELYSHLGYKSKGLMNHSYYGPEYSNEEIKKAIDKFNLEAEYYDDITGIAAELMAKGNIIGWFQGRMEWGPRALGNRSILADPTVPGMNDKVNEVKRREKWRPFGPSILEEKAKDWLENHYHSPFMLLSFQVKKEMQKLIPAVVHIDGSTRPQTVSKETNPIYYKLIKEFDKEKGVPMILNTSFNDKGVPIVRSPSDAIRNFLNMKMDYLVMGNYLIKKNMPSRSEKNTNLQVRGYDKKGKPFKRIAVSVFKKGFVNPIENKLEFLGNEAQFSLPKGDYFLVSYGIETPDEESSDVKEDPVDNKNPPYYFLKESIKIPDVITLNGSDTHLLNLFVKIDNKPAEIKYLNHHCLEASNNKYNHFFSQQMFRDSKNLGNYLKLYLTEGKYNLMTHITNSNIPVLITEEGIEVDKDKSYTINIDSSKIKKFTAEGFVMDKPADKIGLHLTIPDFATYLELDNLKNKKPIGVLDKKWVVNYAFLTKYINDGDYYRYEYITNRKKIAENIKFGGFLKNIELTTDKSQYSPNERIKLNLVIEDSYGNRLAIMKFEKNKKTDLSKPQLFINQNYTKDLSEFLHLENQVNAPEKKGAYNLSVKYNAGFYGLIEKETEIKVI